jgi:diacylglycerol kinase (ATP)
LRKDSVLVVVGGDGMAHLGVDLATQAGIPLGIIPAGTGNDLARHLGIPLGSISAATAHFLAAKKARKIDVAVSQGPEGEETPYVCVLSAGFDAIVNERANSITVPKGRHRYTVALLVELWKLTPLSYEVTIDGKDFSGNYLLVAVANSQSFGGGMKVTPEASLVDGLVDVLLLKPLGRIEFLRIYPRVFKGTHVTDPRVIIQRGASVRVDARGVVAYADGERMSPLPLQVEVRPLALQVFA